MRGNQCPQNDETESMLKELAGKSKELSIKASALLVDLPSNDARRPIVERIVSESGKFSRELRGIS